MKRRLFAILSVIMLAAAFVAAPSTGAAGGTIYLAPNADGGGVDWNYGCCTDRASMPGYNDSASSVRVTGTIPVCLWTNTNFTGSGLRILAPYPASGYYNLPSWMNDKVSSVEWGTNCLTD